MHAYRTEIESQLRWLASAAARAKRTDVALSLLSIGLTAFLPVLVLLGYTHAAALAGCLATFSSAALRALDAPSNWRRYRHLRERLRSECRLFDSGLGPYTDAAGRLELFTARVESLLSDENGEWMRQNLQRDQHRATAESPRPVATAQNPAVERT